MEPKQTVNVDDLDLNQVDNLLKNPNIEKGAGAVDGSIKASLETPPPDPGGDKTKDPNAQTPIIQEPGKPAESAVIPLSTPEPKGDLAVGGVDMSQFESQSKEDVIKQLTHAQKKLGEQGNNLGLVNQQLKVAQEQTTVMSNLLKASQNKPAAVAAIDPQSDLAHDIKDVVIPDDFSSLDEEQSRNTLKDMAKNMIAMKALISKTAQPEITQEQLEEMVNAGVDKKMKARDDKVLDRTLLIKNIKGIQGSHKQYYGTTLPIDELSVMVQDGREITPTDKQALANIDEIRAYAFENNLSHDLDLAHYHKQRSTGAAAHSVKEAEMRGAEKLLDTMNKGPAGQPVLSDVNGTESPGSGEAVLSRENLQKLTPQQIEELTDPSEIGKMIEVLRG